MNEIEAARSLAKLLDLGGYVAADRAADLLSWYNIHFDCLGPDDLRYLADLSNSNRFRAWYCPHCGTCVYEAEPGREVFYLGGRDCEQDLIGCPGNRRTRRWCDPCRRRHTPEPPGRDEVTG